MICQIPSYKKCCQDFDWSDCRRMWQNLGKLVKFVIRFDVFCDWWNWFKNLESNSLQKWWHNVEIMWSFCENWIHRNFSSKRNFDIKLSKIELSSIRNLIQKACLKSSSKMISKCWILAAFPRSDGRKMSTDKLSQGNVIYLEVQVEMLTHL